MCDRDHFHRLEDRVDRLENDATKHHTKVDEQIKTLFAACKENSDTAKTLLKTLVWTVVLIALLGALGLLYGALGDRGFNAVTRAASETAAGAR